METLLKSLLILILINTPITACQNQQRVQRVNKEHYLDSFLSTDAMITLIQLPVIQAKSKNVNFKSELFQQIKDKRFLFLPDRHSENLSMEETTTLIPWLKEAWGMEALVIEVPQSKQMYFNELNEATDPEIIEYILDHIETMFDLNIISQAQIARKMIAECKGNGINIYAINLPEKAEIEMTDYQLVFDLVNKHFPLNQTKTSFIKRMESIERRMETLKDQNPYFRLLQNQFMAATIKELNEGKVGVWVGSAHALPMTTFTLENSTKVYCNSTRRLLGLDQTTSLYFMENQAKGIYRMYNPLEGICISTGTAGAVNNQWNQSLFAKLQSHIPEISKYPFPPIKRDREKVIELANRINHAVSELGD